jgi:uncharacterized protein (DUF58 family)
VNNRNGLLLNTSNMFVWRLTFLFLIFLVPISYVVPDKVVAASYGGSGEDEELRRRAASNCRNYAEGQRLNVQRVLSSRSLGAGNDYEVHLRVQRRGGSDEVTCYTDVRTGSTRIAEARSYGGSGEDEELRRRAASACRKYAEGQRLDLQRVLSSRSLGSGNDYEVHLRVQRRGRPDEITCYTDVRTGSTRIVDGPSYGGSQQDEELRRRAALTCRDYAEAQRLDVDRILSSRPLGAGNDYEVRLRIDRRGRSNEVTCYTDVRTGATRIAN